MRTIAQIVANGTEPLNFFIPFLLTSIAMVSGK
jgi:hypothetical protein